MLRINGFPVGSRETVGVRSFTVPGTQVALAVAADIAPLLIGYAAEYHRLVEPLKPGTCWGYALRPVRGTSSVPSFHGAGIAVDLNAPRHPLGRRGTFTAAQAQTIRRLASKYGLRWGGTYLQRADEMHAEVILPRPQALELVARLQTHPAAPSLGGPPWYRRVLLPGATGDDVIAVQHRLSANPSGVLDQHTRDVLTAWQRAHGLPANGVVGIATAKALGA